MTERRYRDDEIRTIFSLATTQKLVEPTPSASANGLTLRELQTIAREVGVEPDAVARAAVVFNERESTTLRTSLGVPIEVSRTVALPRMLTDHEWERLVAELRTTFRAKGKITTHGGLMEWSNGNLHAWVEPADTGYRLRLGTVKGDAVGVNALGGAAIVASAGIFGALAFWGIPVSVADFAAFVPPALLGAGGIGALAANRRRLSRWAEERERQMAHIAAKIHSIMGMKSDAE